MEHTDVLQALAAAQQDVANHLAQAGHLLSQLPHGVDALVPMKLVMGTLGNRGAGSVTLPT